MLQADFLGSLWVYSMPMTMAGAGPHGGMVPADVRHYYVPGCSLAESAEQAPWGLREENPATG